MNMLESLGEWRALLDSGPVGRLTVEVMTEREVKREA